MYFSVITPSDGQQIAAACECPAEPYGDHQWLWRWFHAASGTRRDFLFRRHETACLPRFYAVSERPPHAQMGAWQAATREYAPRLQAGEQLRFELRANPTVRHARSGKSARHDVVMEAKKRLLAERGLRLWADWKDNRPPLQAVAHEACTHWLARRGEELGFVVESGGVAVEAYRPHREKHGGSLQFSSVDLSGYLTVTDPAAFLPALLKGVGRARGFGCGLLLVRRVEEV